MSTQTSTGPMTMSIQPMRLNCTIILIKGVGIEADCEDSSI